MEDVIAFAADMNEWILKRLLADLKDVTPDEADWRPLPQANNINLIVRHLRIEAKWQLDAMSDGKPMPAEVSPGEQQSIDSIALDDFVGNLEELEKLCNGFIEAMRRTTLAGLEQKEKTGYQEYRAAGVSPPPRFLSFHHAMHLAGHLSQIHTIRNLYRKTRGEPARFYPDNPTFPK